MKIFIAYCLFVACVALICLLVVPPKAALGITLLAAFVAGAVYFYFRPSYRWHAGAKRQVTDKDLEAAERLHSELGRMQGPGKL